MGITLREVIYGVGGGSLMGEGLSWPRPAEPALPPEGIS